MAFFLIIIIFASRIFLSLCQQYITYTETLAINFIVRIEGDWHN